MQLIFNDIGTGEVVLILVFALMFFGAKSIPGLARTFGRTIRQVKEASSEIQNEIRKSGTDMRKDLNLNGLIEETAEDIKRPLDQMAVDLDNAVKYQPPNKNSQIKPAEHQISEEGAADSDNSETISIPNETTDEKPEPTSNTISDQDVTPKQESKESESKA